MIRAVVCAGFLTSVTALFWGDGDAISLATAPPVVVKTVPAAGTTDVDPELKEIRVTFSKEMMDGSWSWSTAGAKDKFPEAGKIRYEEDGKTCVMPVTLDANREYVLGLNWGDHRNFKDRDGRAAVSYLIVFRTAK